MHTSDDVVASVLSLFVKIPGALSAAPTHDGVAQDQRHDHQNLVPLSVFPLT